MPSLKSHQIVKEQMLPIHAGNLPRLRAVRPDKGSRKARKLLQMNSQIKANRRQSSLMGKPKILPAFSLAVNGSEALDGSVQEGHVWAICSQSNRVTLGYFIATALAARQKYMDFGFTLKGQLVLF